MFEIIGQTMIVGMVFIIFSLGISQYKVIHIYSSYQIEKGVFYDIDNNTNIVSIDNKEDVILNTNSNGGEIYVHDPGRVHQSEKLTDKNIVELYNLSGKSFFFKTPSGKSYYNP